MRTPKSPIAPEWNNPKSFFDVKDRLRKGLLQKYYYGQLMIENEIIHFSLSQQVGYSPRDSIPKVRKVEYVLRGFVSLMDQSTCKPLVCAGKERAMRMKSSKTKNALSSPPRAIKNIYCNTTDENEIKAIIVTKARELVAANTAALTESKKMIALTPNYSPLILYWEKFGDSFLRSIGVKDHEKCFRRIVRTIAKLPSNVPIAKLSLKMIEQVQNNKIAKNRISEKSMRLLSRFWDYLGGKTALPENPFHALIVSQNKLKRKDGGKLAIQNATPDHLFPEQEYELNRKLFKLLETEPIVLGIILPKDAGLNLDALLELTWGDVLFDKIESDFVCIRIRSNNSGPIINYTRPVFPFGAIALRKVYEALLLRFAPEKLAKMKVISLDGRPVSKTELSSQIRKMIKGFGVEPKVLFNLQDPGHRTAASLSYLLNTYKSKVHNECGLEVNDPAAIRYLLTMSLNNDVSAAFYRSFSSPDGLWRLYVAMRRIGTGLEQNSSKCNKETSKYESKYTLVAAPVDQRRLLKAEIYIELTPDELVELSSKFGFDATIAVLDEKGEIPEDADTVMYYDTQQVPENYLQAANAEAKAPEDSQTEEQNE